MDINTTTDIAASATNFAMMPSWWPNDIYVGVFFGLLGVTGAAIMVFIGEWDKLMGKSASILEIEDQIDSKRKIADGIKNPDDFSKRKEWEYMISQDEDRLYKERRSSRMQGMILYLFIGGIIAAVLANSMIEAIAFGAGWTGFIGTFGIKKDNEERRKLRNEKEGEVLKDAEKTATSKADEAYYSGYSDAIRDIAKIENKTVNDLIDKLN